MKRRLVMTATVVATLLVVVCTEVKAGFVGLDNRCSELLSRDAAPKLNDNFINSLTSVWASSDGKNGVIFLRNAAATYVMKIEETPDVGVTVSRRILTSLRVPSDMVLVEVNKRRDIQTFYTKLKNALANNPNLVPAGKAQTLARRLTQLDNKDQRTLIITKFLTSYRDAPNLGVAMLPPQDPADIDVATPVGRVAALRRFSAAMEALGSPHNQKLLGYLYMMDVLFGNEDRYFRDAPNLANVYIAAAGSGVLPGIPDGIPCLAAIDNEARAPSQKYMAMNRFLNGARAGQAVGESVTWPRQDITAKDYLDLLMGFNKDQSKADKPTIGPLLSLTGDFYNWRKLQPAEQFSDQNKCDDVAQTNVPVSVPLAVRRRFRAKLVAMINDMQPSLSEWAGAGANIVSNKRFGQQNWGPTVQSGFDEVCSTAVTYILNQGQFRQVLNWPEFDKFFAQGVAEATKDMNNMADMQGKIGLAFVGLPTHKMVDVSVSGLLARAQFINYVARGTLPKTVIDRMLIDNKKEAYAKGGSIDQTTYVWVGDYWEPQE